MSEDETRCLDQEHAGDAGSKKKAARPGAKNLVPNSARTPEQRSERCRQMGIASGAAKRRRKALREELLTLLSDGDTQSRMCIALIDAAINGRSGSERARAFETVRDTVGEKPVERSAHTLVGVEALSQMTDEQLLEMAQGGAPSTADDVGAGAAAADDDGSGADR